MCGVELPVKLIGRERGKTTHTHTKGRGREREERKGGVKGEVRKLEEVIAYIRINTCTHTQTHTHRHTSARRHMKIASVCQSTSMN